MEQISLLSFLIVGTVILLHGIFRIKISKLIPYAVAIFIIFYSFYWWDAPSKIITKSEDNPLNHSSVNATNNPIPSNQSYSTPDVFDMSILNDKGLLR